MNAPNSISTSLQLAGAYRREVRASLARVWENVFDWEHLPALHATSFHSVDLLERDAEGWRVRLVNQPGDVGRAQILELKADRAGAHYVATTLEGTGAGTEIRTRLAALGLRRTAVEVEFHVPATDPKRLAQIGAAYVAAYTRLWDEDEAMMVVREQALAARRRPRPAKPRPMGLGPIEALRERLPLTLTFAGDRFRILEIEGALVIHAATCPHWLGPLDAGPVVDGCVRCPWHGYRFDVRTGASADGRALALSRPPRITVCGGRVTLRPAIGTEIARPQA